MILTRLLALSFILFLLPYLAQAERVLAGNDEAAADQLFTGQFDATEDKMDAEVAAEHDHSAVIWSQSVMQSLVSNQKSHLITVWPNNSKALHELGEYQFQVGLGQQIFDQFLSTRVLHMIFDRIQGHKLPIEMVGLPLQLPGQYSELKDMFGIWYLEISNVRLHKVRITGYRGTNAKMEVVEDEQGGHVRETGKEQKPKKPKQNPKQTSSWFSNWFSWGSKKKQEHADEESESESDSANDEERINVQFKDDEAKPVMHFVERDGVSFIRTAIKGLNLLLQADYVIRSLDTSLDEADRLKKSVVLHKGNILIRATDCVAFLEARTARYAREGFPVLKLGPNAPSIRFGKLDAWVKGDSMDWLGNVAGKIATKYARKWIADQLTRSLAAELPRISALVYKSMEKTIINSINKFFEGKNISRPEFPHLMIQDLRWWIKDKRLFIGANIQHISADRQDQLLKMSQTTFGKKALTAAQQRLVMKEFFFGGSRPSSDAAEAGPEEADPVSAS